MIIMLSQVPQRTFVVSSGNVYVSDQYGIIANVVSTADQEDLTTAGCATLLANAPDDMLGYRIACNMNVTTDQAISNLNNSLKFRPKRIIVTNASISLTTAQGGLYTGAGKTGTIIVAAAQAYSTLTAANIALELTLNSPNIVLPAGTPLFLSLTTAQGAAATADLYIFGDAYPIS